MDLQTLEKEALAEVDQAASLSEVEGLHAKYLGRKDGELTKILRTLNTLSPEEKKNVGQAANVLRNLLEEKIASRQNQLKEAGLREQISKDRVDVSLPGRPFAVGRSHVILETIRRISEIFKQIGFDVADGPELETDTNNFTELNIPENHPARDMHDTFYADPKIKSFDGSTLLLRTHTSPVQIRLMKSVHPPVRILAPGRVYRHEATDATHAAIFHQIEGLAIDKDISFADLKGTLTYFAQKLFGEETKVRFFPSYFPFVEPGAQMDVQCFMCRGEKHLKNGEACPICRASGWIEIMGAGLVHPQVLRNVGYDPKKVSGFAFGMGVERIVMTLYQIRDIRYFLESDMRFLEQFS